MTISKSELGHRKVSDYMTRHVVTARPDDSVSEALQLMVQDKVSALPVVDGHDRCVGVLSSSDLLQLALKFGGELDTLSHSQGLDHQMLLENLERTGFSSQLVREVMTHLPVAVGLDTSLSRAAADMVRNRVHRLAVTDAKGRLLGLISTMDIVRAVAES
jgi:CBS domain-containing protein